MAVPASEATILWLPDFAVTSPRLLDASELDLAVSGDDCEVSTPVGVVDPPMLRL